MSNINIINNASVSNCTFTPSADSIYNSDCLSLDSPDDAYLDVCYYIGKIEILLTDTTNNCYQTFRIDHKNVLKNASVATISNNEKCWYSIYSGAINGDIDKQKPW